MTEERCDVLVIGGGGSGLAAAAEAAKAGARVILVEKNPRIGGSTAWSVGSVSATRTPHQRRAGIHDDNPDWHFEDLGKFAGPLEPRDNLALRRILVDDAPETFDWLLESGVTFIGPASEPPHRRPRMHNVVPGSKAFPHHLGKLCRRLGVDIRTSIRAGAFRIENGRVTGIDATDGTGAPQTFVASRGVVLASGDFSGGADLKAQYASPAAAAATAVNFTNTGDGHKLGVAIGASVVNGDLVHGPILRFVPPEHPSLIARMPPYRWIGQSAMWAMSHLPQPMIRPLLMSFITTALGPDPGLFKAGAALVNRRGERFADELAKPAIELAQQPDGIGYIVMDSAMAERFTAWPHFVSTAPNVAHAYLPDYKRNRRDLYHEASTVAALAKKLAMDPAVLEASIAERGRNGGVALTKPPFLALGPVKSYMVLTDGGLNVTARHEVVGRDGLPIPGLFAAGSAGQGGVLLYGHGHHLGWAFTSGRRAGRFAAQQASA